MLLASLAVIVGRRWWPSSPSTCSLGAISRRRPPTKLVVGLGFIPSVQFAQFYLADQAGYYAEEGLDVTFLNEIDANLVPKVGQGQVDIGMSDGTSVIPAVSQGIPVRYIATVYGQFPSIVFGKASSGSRRPPTSRAGSSASRAATARRGSCSRRCSTRPA